MKIRIYQINPQKDTAKVIFQPFTLLEKLQGNHEINSKIYDLIYDNEVDCKDLEDVFELFNINHPSGYKGRSLSVSDIVEVYESNAVKPGFYFCDICGFKKVSFNPKLV